MAFTVGGLLWDDWNTEHIARHAVKPEEVAQVCAAAPWVLRAQGTDKWAVYGQTDAGRYLLVILAARRGDEFYPVTARDMSNTERRRFRQRRRGR